MNPSIAPAPVSEGQRSNFATVLGDAVRKAAGTVVEELSVTEDEAGLRVQVFFFKQKTAYEIS